MPEGHTLHRLAGALQQAFAGTSPQVTSPQGRFAAGAAALDGHPVGYASAYGKQLFVGFDAAGQERILHVHLGLIGRFDVTGYASSPPPPVGAVRVRLLGPGHLADLRGPTVCEVIDPARMDLILVRLGPDPLRPDADPEAAFRRLSRSRRSIAELLMDQSVVAGLGNVYRCELLFRHRVDPFLPGASLRPATWRALWADAVELLAIGVAYGQIVTVPDQVEQARETLAAGLPPAPPERRHLVYRRAGEPCPSCGARVRTRLVAGRNLFWCGRCQRRR